MSYRDIVAADLRLVILQALEEDPDYSHNDAVLQRMLDAVGHSVSTDRLRTELAWLAEQGLILINEIEDLVVSKLTARGEDVALGRTRVPGVARPRPEV
ncbi:MAG TPA: hypothetical protein ENJ98_01795 [Thiolapillus brandeum]|uniref:ArsR family transcriptional regulator n=1 Tax=Thiolapillus brandeum TaxID=1076588 RepID=A0A7C5N6B5_9GAMM|nr:hypothetical protein [Thiolapillus brandeum]